MSTMNKTHPNRLGRILGLGRADWLALFQALPRIVLVWAGLPVFGVKRLRRWTVRDLPADSTEFDSVLWQRRATAILRIGARLPGCKCLARSLALSWWMHSCGQANDFRIGIAGSAQTFRSHAWVEVGGVPVDDRLENVAAFRVVGGF
ncbi:MAG: lasso peptide biosynthesis B2 protein [Wenzhouxiangellaceae bacterium]|nr:lasso peptide biosynthesis B2 protein [Wenzhouxiangellaceae bacterium]